MTDAKIETGIRYVGEALAAIVKLLLPGDRVKAEYGPDLIIEGLLQADTAGDLRVGPRYVHLTGGPLYMGLTALTVLSLAPRPNPEPWWDGTDAVADASEEPWTVINGFYERAGREPITATELEAHFGPCKPIRQNGRTILSEEEIGAVITEVILHGRTVGHVLTDRYGWQREEK